MPTRTITPFQQRVYDATCRIPAGRVTTYGLLARHLGCRSAQAVGQALRRNPFAPQVPCHRVIAADLRMGGFCGARDGAQILVRREFGLELVVPLAPFFIPVFECLGLGFLIVGLFEVVRGRRLGPAVGLVPIPLRRLPTL